MLLTLKEFAERKGMHPKTLMNWIYRGLVDGAKKVPVPSRHLYEWRIPEETLETLEMPIVGRPKGSTKSEPGKLVKSSLSVEEMKEMFEEEMEFSEIAKLAGVSRQAVHALYSKYMKSSLGTGRERRKRILEKRRYLRREIAANNIWRLKMVREAAESIGYKFEFVRELPTVKGPRGNEAYINGHHCKIMVSTFSNRTNKNRTGPAYHRINVVRDDLELFDFIIMVCGLDAEIMFIIPTKDIERVFDPNQFEKMIYLPAGERRRDHVYKNHRMALKVEDYEEAWSLLEVPASAKLEVIKEIEGTRYKYLVVFGDKIDHLEHRLDIWFSTNTYDSMDALITAARRYRQKRGEEYKLFYVTMKDGSPASLTAWPFPEGVFDQTKNVELPERPTSPPESLADMRSSRPVDQEKNKVFNGLRVISSGSTASQIDNQPELKLEARLIKKNSESWEEYKRRLLESSAAQDDRGRNDLEGPGKGTA